MVDNKSLLTIPTFKGMFDLQVDEMTLTNAINIASKDLFKLLKKRRTLQQDSAVDDLTIQLGNEFPINANLSIDFSSADFDLFEYDSDFVKTDVTNLIESVSFVDLPGNNVIKVAFSEELPRENKRLGIRFNTAKFDIFDDANIDSIRRYLALSAFNTMSKDILLHLKQTGMTTFNINGVSIDVTTADFKSLKESNMEEMQQLYNRFVPLDIRRTVKNNQFLGHRPGNPSFLPGSLRR